jgi:hypothetical protein
MLTFDLITERLKQLDEVSLLEVLDISSEDIVNRFEDFIEDREEELTLELEDYEDADE